MPTNISPEVAPLQKKVLCKNCHHIISWVTQYYDKEQSNELYIKKLTGLETYVNGNPVIICPNCGSYIEIDPEKGNTFTDVRLSTEPEDYYKINDDGFASIIPMNKNYYPDDIYPYNEIEEPYDWYDFKNEYTMMGQRRINLPFSRENQNGNGEETFITVPKIINDGDFYVPPLYSSNYMNYNNSNLEIYDGQALRKEKSSFLQIVDTERSVPIGTSERYYLVYCDDSKLNNRIQQKIVQIDTGKNIISNWSDIVEEFNPYLIPNQASEKQNSYYVLPSASYDSDYLLLKDYDEDSMEIVDLLSDECFNSPIRFSINVKKGLDGYDHSYSTLQITSSSDIEPFNKKTTLSLTTDEENPVYVNFLVVNQPLLKSSKYYLVQLTDETLQNLHLGEEVGRGYVTDWKNFKNTQVIQSTSDIINKKYNQELVFNSSETKDFIIIDENGKIIRSQMTNFNFTHSISSGSLNSIQQNNYFIGDINVTKYSLNYSIETDKTIIQDYGTLYAGFWIGEGVVDRELVAFPVKIIWQTES